MLRLLTSIAPFLLKEPANSLVKTLIGRSAVYALIFAGLVFIIAALFTWVSETYSLEMAFLTVGTILLTGALTCQYIIWSRLSRKKQPSLPKNMEHDLLATQIPETLARDPLIQRILKEIGDNPIPATATALTVGTLLSREFFDGD